MREAIGLVLGDFVELTAERGTIVKAPVIKGEYRAIEVGAFGGAPAAFHAAGAFAQQVRTH